jgi:hypothetical protein
MASVIFNSFLDDLARGNVDLDTDTFWMMLATSSYVPDKDAHLKRSDVTNESSGTGYTSGGKVVTVTVTKDTTNDRLDVTFSSPSWASSSISAAWGIIYKRRGGLASADELVCAIDFGGTVTSTAGTFATNITGPLRIQN